MPRINFQQQLAALKDRLIAMASLAQEALDLSVEAYLRRDSDIAQHVQQVEAKINASERAVDEMAYDLLALEQPMAVDLRFILAVIKINSDLERVGDQSVNIAERAEATQNHTTLELPVDIRDMADRVGRMVRSATQSLLDADAKLAEQVVAMDEEVDALNKRIQATLVRMMEEKPQQSDQALNALLVARNLERAGDHATNIAEDVIFWVRGSDVRHQLHLIEAD